MDIARRLLKEAREIAAQQEERANSLKSQLAEVKKQETRINEYLQSTQLAAKRLLNYPVKLGPDYQCPSCWVLHEQRSRLDPRHGGTENFDIMGCGICGSTYHIPTER